MKRGAVTLFCAILASAAWGGETPRLVIQKDRAGFVDAAGHILVPPRYARVGRWSEGRIWVQDRAAPGSPGTFLDDSAKPAAPARFRDLADIRPELPLPEFRHGVAVVGLADAFGYVDIAGKLLGQTSRIGAFMRQDDPLLLIVDPGRHGFIDRQGAVKIPAQFEQATPFHAGRAAAAESGRWGLIDETGEWVARPEFDDLRPVAEDPRVWTFRKGAKGGLLRRDGVKLAEARYDDVGLVRGDTVSVRQGDRWGLVSVSGGLVFEPRYKWLQPLGDETAFWAAQSASDHWGVVSTNGVERTMTIFDRIDALAPDVWAGWQNDAVGLLSPTNGQWRSEHRYASLVALPDPFRPLAWAVRGDGRGVIDLTTEEVRVPFRHAQIRPWGALLAGQDGRLVRLYDKTGRVVQEWEGPLAGLPEFESLQGGVGALRTATGGTLIRADGTLPLKDGFEAVGPWSAGLLAARREGRWGLVDIEGRWAVEPRFEGMGAFSGTVAPAAESGRWGLIDRMGRWVAEPGFEAIGPAWNGRFPARRGTGWGLIDATGAEVLPCVYDGLEWGFDELGVTRFHGIDPAFIPELEFYGRSRR